MRNSLSRGARLLLALGIGLVGSAFRSSGGRSRGSIIQRTRSADPLDSAGSFSTRQFLEEGSNEPLRWTSMEAEGVNVRFDGKTKTDELFGLLFSFIC